MSTLIHTDGTPYINGVGCGATIDGAELQVGDGVGIAIEAAWTAGTTAPTGTLVLQGRVSKASNAIGSWRDIQTFTTSPAGSAGGCLEQFYPIHYPSIRVRWTRTSGSANSLMYVWICVKSHRG